MESFYLILSYEVFWRLELHFSEKKYFPEEIDIMSLKDLMVTHIETMAAKNHIKYSNLR